MSDTATPRSAVALESLLNQRDRFAKLGEKDFAAATMLLAKKLMISAGQTTDDMKHLRETVGADLFETTLKSKFETVQNQPTLLAAVEEKIKLCKRSQKSIRY